MMEILEVMSWIVNGGLVLGAVWTVWHNLSQ
jgi:hypothetical protein